MKIHPPKRVQVVLHRGAKVKEQPQERLLKAEYDFLEWKSNDRAVLTFENLAQLERHQAEVQGIVRQWLTATKPLT